MATGSSRLNKMRRKPVQARSQERVQRILNVAEDLFTNQGYAATTTKAIAAQSQIHWVALPVFSKQRGNCTSVICALQRFASPAISTF
ncbi:MAG: TetR family transcriptional regulator [Cyanobacteria bacterium J06560_6]